MGEVPIVPSRSRGSFPRGSVLVVPSQDIFPFSGTQYRTFEFFTRSILPPYLFFMSFRASGQS